MKKILIVLITFGLIASVLTGCQNATKNMGGSMLLELNPNQKLEEITWKEDSLWYLTRPMTEDDIAETHIFQQKSEFGILEGDITIIESKGE